MREGAGLTLLFTSCRQHHRPGIRLQIVRGDGQSEILEDEPLGPNVTSGSGLAVRVALGPTLLLHSLLLNALQYTSRRHLPRIAGVEHRVQEAALEYVKRVTSGAQNKLFQDYLQNFVDGGEEEMVRLSRSAYALMHSDMQCTRHSDDACLVTLNLEKADIEAKVKVRSAGDSSKSTKVDVTQAVKQASEATEANRKSIGQRLSVRNRRSTGALVGEVKVSKNGGRSVRSGKVEKQARAGPSHFTLTKTASERFTRNNTGSLLICKRQARSQTGKKSTKLGHGESTGSLTD